MNPLDWDLGNLPPGLPWGGVDEAGRGAWAGPVVAACAVIDHAAAARWGHVLREARDSKLVAPEKRASLARELKMVLPAWGVAEVDNMAIDRDNILEASLSAMRHAVDACALKPRILLVDGNRAPRTGLPERLVVDGDALSCAVACASILAKAHRDALMEGLEDVFPGYGFRANKGYGTPSHRKGLAALGPSPVHRVSFAPVAALQQADETLPQALAAAMEACATVADLQAWVEASLRPAYGRLRPAWIGALRSRYAERLAVLAGEDQA